MKNDKIQVPPHNTFARIIPVEAFAAFKSIITVPQGDTPSEAPSGCHSQSAIASRPNQMKTVEAQAFVIATTPA